MEFTENKSFLRWTIISAAVIVISLILWNTYTFYQQLKEIEKRNIVEYAEAQKKINTSGLDDDIGFALQVIQHNTTIPIIIVNKNGEYITNNLPEQYENDTAAIEKLIEEFKLENEPILSYLDGTEGAHTTTYYGNSTILTKLKYYPAALILIMILLGAVIWFFYRSNKASEQNKLWAGMAKESAHQIGTPLSSLVGWTTILKDSEIDPTYVAEMEKDIDRLQMITDRFSKIGSIPELAEHDIVKETEQATRYISARSSKLVDFNIDLPEQPIPVRLNTQLYSWVIENLIKNGIDAMRGKGQITVFLRADAHKVMIRISDTGKGIPKKLWNRVFNPGYTTKKRGWGLGLSLARRIIADYHNGRIRVANSTKNEGTTFEIVLPKFV